MRPDAGKTVGTLMKARLGLPNNAHSLVRTIIFGQSLPIEV
jgi:hypothetical protein